MTAPARPYRPQHTDEHLHAICRKCCGVGDAHSLRCQTLQLPRGVPLYKDSRIPPERNGGGERFGQ